MSRRAIATTVAVVGAGSLLLYFLFKNKHNNCKDESHSGNNGTLAKDFASAVDLVNKSGVGGMSLANQLQLYALFKQATCGENISSRKPVCPVD